MQELWILNHYALSPDMPGGTRHYDFGSELSKRGYKVTIFASSFHYNLHRELKLSESNREKHKIENINGIRFIWIKTFPYKRNDWRRVVNMVSYMWRVYWVGRDITRHGDANRKPDVIIGSSVHLLAVLSAYWLARLYDARFIMEVRDLWPQSIVDMGMLSDRNPIIWVLRLLEKYLYQKATKIITLMPNAGEYITKLGIPDNKIVPIPNGVHLAAFVDSSKTRSDQSFKILYVGSHGPANGLKNLLLAAKIVQDRGEPGIRFYLMGEGSDKPNLIDLQNRLSLANLDFIEPVPKKEVPKWLMSADALMHIELEFGTAKYGGSPNKLYDYLAAGKPLIYASNWVKGNLDEIHCGIYADPDGPESIADAAITLHRMPPPRASGHGKEGSSLC